MILSVIIVLAAFGIFYLISEENSYKNIFVSADGIESKTARIIATRLVGLIFFGLIPWFIWKKAGHDVLEFMNGQDKMVETLLWSFLCGLIIVPLIYFSSRRQAHLDRYPQIRSTTWSPGLLAVSALTWILYLFAYEFLFRGLLLFSCVEAIGIYWAIFINLILYAVVHIPKGKTEILGSIPFGLVLCLLTLKTGNIWVAIIVHSILALSNEWISLARHKSISVKWR